MQGWIKQFAQRGKVGLIVIDFVGAFSWVGLWWGTHLNISLFILYYSCASTAFSIIINNNAQEIIKEKDMEN